jgi:uncharacterized membrane protein SpoIIM required for sporulation
VGHPALVGARLACGRRRAWHELLAATIVTMAIAVPLLILAAALETWVTPGLLTAVSGVASRYTF